MCALRNPFQFCYNYHKSEYQEYAAMPTISQFYGIKITMNYNDHLPPHFHAEYQGSEAIIEIANGNVTGEMPRRPLRMI